MTHKKFSIESCAASSSSLSNKLLSRKREKGKGHFQTADAILLDFVNTLGKKVFRNLICVLKSKAKNTVITQNAAGVNTKTFHLLFGCGFMSVAGN